MLEQVDSQCSASKPLPFSDSYSLLANEPGESRSPACTSRPASIPGCQGPRSARFSAGIEVDLSLGKIAWGDAQFRSPTPVSEVVRYRHDEPPSEVSALKKQVRDSDLRGSAPAPPPKPRESVKPNMCGVTGRAPTDKSRWIPWSLFRRQRPKMKDSKGKGYSQVASNGK